MSEIGGEQLANEKIIFKPIPKTEVPASKEVREEEVNRELVKKELRDAIERFRKQPHMEGTVLKEDDLQPVVSIRYEVDPLRGRTITQRFIDRDGKPIKVVADSVGFSQEGLTDAPDHADSGDELHDGFYQSIKQTDPVYFDPDIVNPTHITSTVTSFGNTLINAKYDIDTASLRITERNDHTKPLNLEFSIAGGKLESMRRTEPANWEKRTTTIQFREANSSPKIT